MQEELAALPGRKSTATTKGTPTTRLVLERFGLLPFFEHVQGTDGFGANGRCQTVLAELDDRFQGVGPAAQKAQLFFA